MATTIETEAETLSDGAVLRDVVLGVVAVDKAVVAGVVLVVVGVERTKPNMQSASVTGQPCLFLRFLIGDADV